MGGDRTAHDLSERLGLGATAAPSTSHTATCPRPYSSVTVPRPVDENPLSVGSDAPAGPATTPIADNDSVRHIPVQPTTLAMLESATGFTKAQTKQVAQPVQGPTIRKGLVGVVADESTISTVGKAVRANVKKGRSTSTIRVAAAPDPCSAAAPR
eukprot:scaffold3720_cov401-Prasinococcus_capsulatus_cf.AAC.17